MTPDDPEIRIIMTPDDPEKLMRWGIGDRGDDRPSIWDLRACLLSSVDSAEEFAHDLPESAATVTRFAQEIRRIIKELMSSFHGRLAPPSPFFKIMDGLTGARALASKMAERDPENSEALMRFVESLIHAQEEFRRRVRSDAKPYG
jgi:hypothetical protein